jgi:hypothetical protein
MGDSLVSSRPFWVVVLGAGISVTVVVLSLVYRIYACVTWLVRKSVAALYLVRKRIARFVWVVWYESTQKILKWVSKMGKRRRRFRQQLGNVIRR